MIVMMDLSMPEVDGLQATAALRAISNFKDYPETLSVDKAFKAGCDAYLRKPVDLADLGAALRRFLRTA